ncbi:hypothetical protein FB45DRAFT_974535 [Roridomyces roridus]|uniref:Uncharacterized protein n=1 Tax=Roridomyces roridus TaxID=1738132 RepID=A0AAD7CML5_9AGAR|nr:hypothetical protein FB45DRAFT_974535 [Roridomyces roridus]
MPANESSESASTAAPPHPCFPHPFHKDPHHGTFNEPVFGCHYPRPLADLRMCRLSSHIRQKPRWWEKMLNPNIRSKWIQEAKEQQQHLTHGERLTDEMLDYVMDELDGYAELRDGKTGIECGPYHAIFFSDYLIPQDLTGALQRAVKSLEDVPEQEKDWHPGSKGRVLDLVHPSMYPLVYGETYGTFSEGQVSTIDPPVPASDESEDHRVDDIFISNQFQWLPSDFQVDGKGAVKLASSYINNIHPQHHDQLVPVIERVLEHAVPMWERVLSALDDGPRGFGGGVSLACYCVREPGANLVEDYDDMEDWRERENDYEAWLQGKIDCGALTLYECWPYRRFEGRPEKKFSLAESRIQVIVKLANIVLTPEKPEYPGGIWHVEGMAGESIVSTFIYYYESENIEPCDLSFRAATAAPDYHDQNDDICMRNIYGMATADPCVQDIGSIETKAGRCVAFPNIYQRRVSPFQLADETKPGVRKILVFFLVDPTVHVPSTSVVGPQQVEVVKYTLLQVTHEGAASSRLAMLPVELLDYIGGLVPGTMSRADAEEIREELMEERSVMITSVNTEFFARDFNMW